MDEIKSYRDLKVWRDGMTLVEDCYRFSNEFPKEELAGLTSQLQRAAVCVPANIADGFGRENLRREGDDMNGSQEGAKPAAYSLVPTAFRLGKERCR